MATPPEALPRHELERKLRRARTTADDRGHRYESVLAAEAAVLAGLSTSAGERRAVARRLEALGIVDSGQRALIRTGSADGAVRAQRS